MRAQRFGKPFHQALQQLELAVAIIDAERTPLYHNTAAAPLLAQLEPAALSSAAENTNGEQWRSTVARTATSSVRLRAIALDQATNTVLITLHDLADQQREEQSYRKLTHTISHELLTPLTAIQGHLAHIAASDRLDEAAWTGSLRITRDEVDRLTRLTSSLLILARLESGQPLQRRPVNLGAIAEEAVLQLLDKADKRTITLNLHTAPRLPRLSLDRDNWKQVFLNLINNAIKYGAESGHVDISLDVEHEMLRIRVADDGAGIAPEDQAHLFDEFFRADSQRHVGGSGLGLAIVRRIVERHGGQIDCTSALGIGTTFTILLSSNETDVTSSLPSRDTTLPQPDAEVTSR